MFGFPCVCLPSVHLGWFKIGVKNRHAIYCIPSASKNTCVELADGKGRDGSQVGGSASHHDVRWWGLSLAGLWQEKAGLVTRKRRALTGLWTLSTGSGSDSFGVASDSREVLCIYTQQIFMEPATEYMGVRETSRPPFAPQGEGEMCFGKNKAR